MALKSSFSFVFYDLLSLIDDTTIIYRHKVFPEIIQGYNIGVYATGKSKWGLSITHFFNSKSLKEFNEAIERCIDKLVVYIKSNGLELTSFFEYFIKEIESRITLFSELKENKLNLGDLVKSKKFHLDYLGYSQPHEDEEEYDIFSGLGAYKEPPAPSDYDEFSYLEIQRLLVRFLESAIGKLNRLVLFLKHESNILSHQKSKLANPKEDGKLIDMIWDGKIKQLFEQLKKDKRYKSNFSLIQLSARYNSLENDKNQGVISRDEYDLQHNKVISSLIEVFSKEN